MRKAERSSKSTRSSPARSVGDLVLLDIGLVFQCGVGTSRLPVLRCSRCRGDRKNSTRPKSNPEGGFNERLAYDRATPRNHLRGFSRYCSHVYRLGYCCYCRCQRLGLRQAGLFPLLWLVFRMALPTSVYLATFHDEAEGSDRSLSSSVD